MGFPPETGLWTCRTFNKKTTQAMDFIASAQLDKQADELAKLHGVEVWKIRSALQHDKGSLDRKVAWRDIGIDDPDAIPEDHLGAFIKHIVRF